MDFWVNARRVARYGFIGFVRNGFVSLSAVLIMTITLFVVSILMIGGAALSSTLRDITEKVDVTVYFTLNASEEQVLAVKQSLDALPEVALATYVSSEDALAAFRERHKNDQLTIQALNELAENPLGPSLEIRAKQTSQYESIAESLSAQQEADGADSIIEKINFYQNKTAIDRLTNIIETSRRFGISIALIFGAATLLIAFNTIRLAIYTARDEIGVMNLVGAGRWYVRGPFMIAGVLYGVVSGIMVLLILYPLTLWLGPGSEQFFGSFNVFNYFVEAFPIIFLVVMISGIGLGSLSSYLAVRRYLKA